MVNENSQTPHRHHQELHPEAVMVAIICGSELHIDQVDCGIRTPDVDHLEKSTEQLCNEGTGGGCGITWQSRDGGVTSHLHGCVIEGDEGAQQIQVARGEHYGKQDLAFPRDTFKKTSERKMSELFSVSFS